MNHSSATAMVAESVRTPPADLSPAREKFHLLPHEIVFSAFLLLTWLRLVACGAAATFPALAFLGFLVMSGGVIAWAARAPSDWRWRVRLLFYPALMGMSFYVLEPAMKVLQVPNADALLNRWDIALLGTNLSVAWQHYITPGLTNVMTVSYMFYFVYLVGGPATYCLWDLAKFRLCFVGMFTVHGLGFIGYTLWPAIAPYRYLTFEQPLAENWFSQMGVMAVSGGSNGVDEFPSLHLAVSLYLLGFDWKFNRRRFWWVLLPCVALWISTIYLRYHYFVDLLAGALVTVVGWTVAAVWARAQTARSPSAATVSADPWGFGASLNCPPWRIQTEPAPTNRSRGGLPQPAAWRSSEMPRSQGSRQ